MSISSTLKALEKLSGLAGIKLLRKYVFWVALISIACSCGHRPSKQLEAFKSAESKNALILRSNQEAELAEIYGNYVGQYSEEKGRIRVVVTKGGTPQAVYYQRIEEGVKDGNGVVLYDAKHYELLREQKTLQENAEKRLSVEADIDKIGMALRFFEVDHGEYPPGLQDLVKAPAGSALWRGPYLEAHLLNDPWGRAYMYVLPGVRNPHGFDLKSLGADGVDSADDILN